MPSFFVDLSSKEPQPTPPGLLTERKPGTPTKRASGTAGGEENTARNALVGQGKAGKKAVLPPRLQKRLASLPQRPSPAEILNKERLVGEKREEMLRAKVEDAREHESKAEGVRERKKEYEKNMVLLGNCVPSNKRQVEPVKLPAKLQRRLAKLEAAVPGRDQLLGKEDDVAARRRDRLAQLVAKHRAHGEIVAKRMAAKATQARFEAPAPAFLPPKLAARLAELQRPTSDALLRKEALASGRRRVQLEARAAACHEHQVRVAQARATVASFRANGLDFGDVGTAPKATSLPKRLSKRLEALAPKWTEEALMAKEQAAQARRAARLSAIATAQKEGLRKVAERRAARFTEPRFDADRLASLPKRLRTRLERVRVPTKAALLAKERMAAQRAAQRTAAVAHAARGQQARAARVQAAKASFIANNMEIATTETTGSPVPVKLPKRLRDRLEALKAARCNAGKLLAREERAETLRADKLEGIVAQSSEHNRKADELRKHKMLQPRFSNNAAPSFLPESLRDRMARIQRRTPEAILRKNDLAAQRAAVHRAAKAHTARQHLLSVAEAVQLKAEMVATGVEVVTGPAAPPAALPARLARRAKQLRPKWTPTLLLVREEAATERRRAALAGRRAFARAHNSTKVAPRLSQSTRQARFGAQAGAPELPAHLQARLASLTRPTEAAVMRKFARALARREVHLASVRHDAHARAHRVAEVRAVKEQMAVVDVDFCAVPSPGPRVPAAMAKRLTPRKQPEATTLIAKEERAAAARKSRLAAIRAKARRHGAVVKGRREAKETVLRFAERPVAEFVPAGLRKRLERYRKPTPAAILRRNAGAAQRARLHREATAQAARLHSEHVGDVKKLGAAFRDSMELLTKDQSRPVVLPARLRARQSELEARMPGKEAILSKAEKAAGARQELLKARAVKAAQHTRRVGAVCKDKTTVPRFTEEEIEASGLPAHLQERLRELRTPTKESIEKRQERAAQRHMRSLEARMDSASKHARYVAKVAELKKEFAKNNVHFMGLDDERVESPEVPPTLRKTLDTHAQQFQSALRSPEDIQRKQSAVQNQREALISERVAGCKQHSEVVARRLQEHQAQRSEASEEVPETN